jgi:hypothetical protein
MYPTEGLGCLISSKHKLKHPLEEKQVLPIKTIKKQTHYKKAFRHSPEGLLVLSIPLRVK